MNIDKPVTSLKNIPIKRTRWVTEQKRLANRRYRRQVNSWAKRGISYVPAPKLTEWDVW